MSDFDRTLVVRQSFDMEDETIRILVLDGYLNFETYEIARAALNRLLENHLYRIVFDLSQTKYIASSGWAIFLAALSSTEAMGGGIKLAGMNPDVKFVFDALELENIVEHFDTVREAADSFKK
ncbi:MAG: STAS domain-containing protein [Spirochaetia bacterium]|nr:STAS domain-containing protein [Spirochaetia bacterium]